jgi:methylsterol monooxygenase
MAFTNNFSTSFRWWDRIFGTDDKYRAYRKKVKEAKKAMQGQSEEKKKEWEQALMKQIEKEGIEAEKEAEARSMFGGSRKTD